MSIAIDTPILPLTFASKSMPAPKSHAQKCLEKLGLRRAIDFVLHLPLRYEDETRLVRLADAQEGEAVQFDATVVAADVSLRGKRQLVVTVDDGSAVCVLRFFTFYAALQKILQVGNKVRVQGIIKGGDYSNYAVQSLTIMHPNVQFAGAELPQTLTPIYPTTTGLPQTYLRKAILNQLQRAHNTHACDVVATVKNGIFSETLPASVLKKLSALTQPQMGEAWSLQQALVFLHQPPADSHILALENRSHPAWQRLKFEELLAQQLAQLNARLERDTLHAPALLAEKKTHIGVFAGLLATLPFKLTAAQQRVCEEIKTDLQKTTPMHRLLQGDVGSGKTVVAALAAALCIDAGWQCALMAPTEILAQQHFNKLLAWLSPLGVVTAQLVGSQNAAKRRNMLALVASGEAGLVVGTHAVIQNKVIFKRLAFAIIDEQHRFGVAQRLALRDKMHPDALLDSTTAQPKKAEPHLLMMTATPIPRTLAMSYCADLDVSTIDELPPGRTPIVTKVMHENKRRDLIERIKQNVQQGRQVYWVCPLIQESETLDLSNATQIHQDLQDALSGVLSNGGLVKVGLLHSKMPVEEKKVIMNDFMGAVLQVLVSTTVIEVGVDVPNASLMVIDNAQRFGLSQLHQLRGRVGRGGVASACVLMYSTGDAPRLSETARYRLHAMRDTNDGFEIARRDLELRGPGEFLGAKQSGAAMLRFADLATDSHLLDFARELAPIMKRHYPDLAKEHVQRWLGAKGEFLKA